MRIHQAAICAHDDVEMPSDSYSDGAVEVSSEHLDGKYIAMNAICAKNFSKWNDQHGGIFEEIQGGTTVRTRIECSTCKVQTELPQYVARIFLLNYYFVSIYFLHASHTDSQAPSSRIPRRCARERPQVDC